MGIAAFLPTIALIYAQFPHSHGCLVSRRDILAESASSLSMAACRQRSLSSLSPLPLLQAISACVCTFCARWANLIDESVSYSASSANEQVTMMRVSELPTSDSLRMRVNLDQRKGTWSDPLTSALMVFPRQLRDRLIFLAYYRPYPCTLLFPTFSLPARSTRLNRHSIVLPSASILSNRRVKTTWERDEHSFRSVSRIFLRMLPLLIRDIAQASLAIGWEERFCTTQLLLPESLIFSSGPPTASRSIRFSLYISIIEQLSLAPASTLANISFTTEGASPSSLPNMVYVLPLPVRPQAKIVALYPSRKVLAASWPASRKTLCWEAEASKMQSNLQIFLSWRTAWGGRRWRSAEGVVQGRMRRQVLMLEPRVSLGGKWSVVPAVRSVSSNSVLSCSFSCYVTPKALGRPCRLLSPYGSCRWRAGARGEPLGMCGGCWFGQSSGRREEQFFIVVIRRYQSHSKLKGGSWGLGDIGK